jgi:molybdate transport system substrate-binding protein
VNGALASLVVIAALAAAGPGSAREQLTVAVAANLKPALDELERAFEAAHPGVEVAVTFGASGALFAQIQNGAPFDLFLSADREYPRKIVAAGLAAGEVVYAIGRLAVWLPKDVAADVEGRGLAALADPSVRRVAIANPAVAPYGRAAEAALRSARVYEAVKPKLVLGESVSQAARFAHSGAADAAIVPLSLARAPALAEAGRVVPISAGAHPPIEQSAVILSAARSPALARNFLSFVLGVEGRRLLATHGYLAP